MAATPKANATSTSENPAVCRPSGFMLPHILIFSSRPVNANHSGNA
jgi:hypothetical protein